jgi:hypothetical protein
MIEAATTALEPATEAPLYHHVSILKFIIYSICSFGIYHLFWAYKSWKFIKQRDGRQIMPFWRAIFLPIWCYSLTRDIAEARGGVKSSIVIAVAGAYLVMSVLGWLPDPYWMISLGYFIPLLYPVKMIDEVNRSRGVRGPYYSRVKIRHVAGCLFGSVILALIVGEVFGLTPDTPDTKVLSGEQLSKRHAAWLRATGVVNPNETIEYFYSSALFSLRRQGYLITNQGVTAYERSNGRLTVQRAAYPEIENIDVTYSESWLDDTDVLIEPRDSDGFYLMFSSEEKLDRRCVKRLLDLWERSKSLASEKQ